MADFAHLHVHTQYSLLDGAIRLDDLFDRAVSFGMDALAITDHGNMFGAIEFYQKAWAKGIKPIIGCEIYVAPKSRFDRKSEGITDASYHLIVLVKDQKGYKNLMQLVTISYLEGFYYKPRVDKDLLRQYNEGLIALSSCLKGEIPYLIIHGKENEAMETAKEFSHIFQDGRFYLEIMENELPEQKKVNDVLKEISRQLSLPLVATNDCHYLSQKDKGAHDILLCIQTGKTVEDEERLRFRSGDFYFRSPEEMAGLFKDCPEALENTLRIAKECNLDLELDRLHLPSFKIEEGLTPEQYIEKMALEGLGKRLSPKNLVSSAKEKYFQRLKDELNVINRMGFAGYFLIVADFINYARENHIPVGPGRGSAAGSLVAYSLQITDVDPIPYGLLFERFLNPERITMPDIDVDFCMDRRDKVIKYVTEKYGKDCVAQIITFGSMAARAVVRDVGRALNMPYAEVDKIAKLIPEGFSITLKDAIRDVPELKQTAQRDERIKNLIEIAMALEGLPRHASTHAAGIVISNKPLTEYLPLYKDPKGNGGIVTQYSMSHLEKIGLIKFDFLGLKTLTVIDKTLQQIRRKGEKFDLEQIDLKDYATYQLLSSGEATGVFQLESPGMRDLLIRIKPSNIEDLIALIALYRPGPLRSGMVDDFINRKQGKTPISFEVPQLEEILGETCGVIVYQEQVMQIARKLAGFSAAEADIMRKAMGKKKPEEMAKLQEKFVSGALALGIDPSKTRRIFEHIARFAEYGFNKSHSTAYALIAYQTAYLKTHYPLEFMASLLTNDMDNTNKIMRYLSECQDRGIKVLAPDINISYGDFTVDGDKILFGLTAVKTVGEGAVLAIMEAREAKGAFTSFHNFCQEVDLRKVNRRVIENLIKCGAFDCLAQPRARMMAELNDAIEKAQSSQTRKLNKQMSMFELIEDKNPLDKSNLPEIEEWPKAEFLTYEKEALGFYITDHPLSPYTPYLNTLTSADTSSVQNLKTGETITLAGIVSSVKEISTKKDGKRMAYVTLEDLKGIIELIAFPDVYAVHSKLLKDDKPILVTGEPEVSEEGARVIVKKVQLLEEIKEKPVKRMWIKIDPDKVTVGHLKRLKEVLIPHKGETKLYLNVTIPKKKEAIISSSLSVHVKDGLIEEIEKLLGYKSVQLE